MGKTEYENLKGYTVAVPISLMLRVCEQAREEITYIQMLRDVISKTAQTS